MESEEYPDHARTFEYDDEQITKALDSLHSAMEALDMANWRLEELVEEDEDKVVRKLRRDIRTVRTVLEHRSREHPYSQPPGIDQDRFKQLRSETPNTK